MALFVLLRKEIMMIIFQWILVFMFAYFGIYTIISRICQCVERCAFVKAYREFIGDKNFTKDLDKVRKEVNEYVETQFNKK